MTLVSKVPRQAATYRRAAYFYGSAREGMKDFLGNIIRERGVRKVLLPGYIGWSSREGSGVFDPVKEHHLGASFYRIQDDLTIDVESVERLARTGQYGVLVVIHYFGKPEPHLPEIRAIADRMGIVLVEDLAHAFYGAWLSGHLGELGDVHLYSLHKMLPLEYGGMVTYRDQSLVVGQVSTHPELALEVLSYDWRSIARRRQEVFRATADQLRRLPEHGSLFTLLWSDLGPDDVPQTLPVRVIGDNRDRIYHEMNSKGFGFVSLYHTLIDEITDPVAVDLARHIINMPCHQDMSLDQVPAMVSAFRNSLGS